MNMNMNMNMNTHVHVLRNDLIIASPSAWVAENGLLHFHASTYNLRNALRIAYAITDFPSHEEHYVAHALVFERDWTVTDHVSLKNYVTLGTDYYYYDGADALLLAKTHGPLQ